MLERNMQKVTCWESQNQAVKDEWIAYQEFLKRKQAEKEKSEEPSKKIEVKRETKSPDSESPLTESLASAPPR